MTDHYAVFGNPVGHSKSPRIHALFAAQTGQDLSYGAVLVPTDGFAAALREFAAGGGKGANVTVPLKEEAFRIATRLSARAQAAGAVNTLTLAGGEIAGDNTDGAGLVRDLKENLRFSLHGCRVLLIGAGGAARGVILPLMDEAPAELVVANRTREKARQLAAALADHQPGPVGTGFADLVGRRFDLVINATSAGLAGTAPVLPAEVFAPGALAYEMVYGRDTPFLADARAAGARAADGLGMLVEQAAESFRVWRGVRPDTASVLARLREEAAGG